MKTEIRQFCARVTASVAEGGKYLSDASVGVASAIDRHHEKISDHADSVAKAAKVAAGVAVAGAAVAAPTGLTAVGVAVGLVSAPAIVTAAPLIASAAGIAITVSAGASLYSKFRRRRAKAKSDAVSMPVCVSVVIPTVG